MVKYPAPIRANQQKNLRNTCTSHGNTSVMKLTTAVWNSYHAVEASAVQRLYTNLKAENILQKINFQARFT